jgi:hypothetical protein
VRTAEGERLLAAKSPGAAAEDSRRVSGHATLSGRRASAVNGDCARTRADCSRTCERDEEPAVTVTDAALQPVRFGRH